MKVRVSIGRIRAATGQPVDAGAVRRQISQALAATLAQSGGWKASKVDRVRVEAGRPGSSEWAARVADAVARMARSR